MIKQRQLFFDIFDLTAETSVTVAHCLFCYHYISQGGYVFIDVS